MTTTKKILRMLGVAGLLVASGGAQAQSPMACELAAALTGSGAKKVYAAKANLRCTADGNAIQIDEISPDAYPRIDRMVFRIKGAHR